ncbi:MAG TPA: quinone oxidoreductase [Thermoanaerobaculia bacterium]|nr:quinone oxidoreductase [Thermoanaerobaculia bacterium]
MKAVRVHAAGGPEALVFEEVPRPQPKAGEALVRIEAAGVNFIDVYVRTGQYKASLPAIVGQEAAGVVEEVASDVAGVRPGDRVAYYLTLGAYAQFAAVPAGRLVALPEGVTTRQAAAVLLQGMTAHYLTHSTYPLRGGETCLVHAAAGGVGLLLCQIAKKKGARVIGTVGTPEKGRRARQAGADEAILYNEVDFAAETRRLTDGRGVAVVYESVGKTTFDKSLDCLAPRGYLVLFGQSSGPVSPLDPQVLNQKGSLFLTRPTLGHYVAAREELSERSSAIFSWIRDGSLEVTIDRELPLASAAEAHRLLQSRATSGKILLIP